MHTSGGREVEEFSAVLATGNRGVREHFYKGRSVGYDPSGRWSHIWEYSLVKQAWRQQAHALLSSHNRVV